jgi:opacity protein-like surface antigen
MLTAPASASGDANLISGQKSLGEAQLEGFGVDGQSQMGIAISVDFDLPVMLAVDLLVSSDDHTIVVPAENRLEYWSDVQTTELDLGVRKVWGSKLKPYVGGGLALVELDFFQIESGDLGLPDTDYLTRTINDSDSGLGFWLNAGLFYRLGKYLNVGIDIRYSDADVEILLLESDEFLELDSGGSHYGVLFGYHW